MKETIVILAFIASIVHSCARFDQIVKWVRSNRADVWDQIGKPIGYFWQSPDSTYFRGIAARERLLGLLAVKTPQWLHDAPDLHKPLQQMRTSVWIGMVLAVIMLAQFLAQ